LKCETSLERKILK